MIAPAPYTDRLRMVVATACPAVTGRGGGGGDDDGGGGGAQGGWRGDS